MADPNQGLLQDIPAYPIAPTGYPFGSAEYQAAILPFLEKQLQAQAERASNARGMFFSGPAQADEQQAAAMLAYNMAQQGASQAENEKILNEQQAFQQQMQREQEQAQNNLVQQQGAAQMKAGALQGGLGALGTLGALKYMGMFGKPAATSVAGTAGSSPGGLEYVTATPAPAAGYTTPALPWYDSNVPGSSTLPGSEAPAGMLGEAYSPVNLGAGGLSALAGYNIGGGNKGSLQDELGGGIGGGLGFLVGGPLGAGVGSFAGRQIGDFLGKLF